MSKSKRKIILNVAISLDGFIEGPNGEIDWCLTDQDYGFNAFLDSIDTIFMGRKSYEVLQKLDPAAFSDKQIYVFSNTLKNDDLNIISSPISESINDIIQKEGKNIWLFGGGVLIEEFVKNQWIDDMMLAVHPIILGKGMPLFNNTERFKLELIASEAYKTGMIVSHYKIK